MIHDKYLSSPTKRFHGIAKHLKRRMRRGNLKSLYFPFILIRRFQSDEKMESLQQK